jgi:hypothetical protein
MVPFTGDQYESVHKAMMALIRQLEGHDYHGPKFSKLLRDIATDSRQYVEVLLCPHYTDYYF